MTSVFDKPDLNMSDPAQPGTSDASGSEAVTFDEPGKLLEELEHLKKENSYLRSRVRYLESERSKCKPSKWSKVKGALGWEKEKDEKESSVTLKVPDRTPSDPSSSFSVSPAGSCLSHSSLTTPPLPLSSSSSEEDILQVERKGCSLKIEHNRRKNNESRRSKSLDGESTLPSEDQGAKASSPKSSRPKGGKTPWSKVKGIINTKTVKKRSASQEERWTRSSLLHESGETEDHSQDEDQSGLNSLATPKLTVTLPSNEELSVEPSSKKHGWLDSPNRADNGDVSPGLSRKSKWLKVRNVFLQGSRSAPSSPVRSASFTYEIEGDDMSSGDVLEEKEDDIFQDEEHLRYEIEASYIQLQNKLEEEMSKKYCREVNLSPEFKKKLEEWDKMKLQGGTTAGGATKDWEQEKDRKKKWAKGVERDSDKAEEDKMNKKLHSREGSFKKHQGTSGGRQEVLIPTSTGTFRFEGISDNFTRKLYEWEQARGIAPEASTFALLGPEYQPASFYRIDDNGNGGIARSKSIGSIADLGQVAQTLVQQPSSLSLNDMDELTYCAGINRMGHGDVEIPEILSRGPLFCTTFAADDVPKMGNSDSSDDEREGINDTFRDQMVNSSYQLLQDNITLLDKLKKERAVCRQLEDDMKTLEGQINSVSKSFSIDHSPGEHVDQEDIMEGGECFDDSYQMEMCYDNRHLDLIAEEIQCRHSSSLRDYETNLQDSNNRRTLFDDEATQTINFDDNVHLAYHICHGFCNGDVDNGLHLGVIQRIVSELQDLANRLELTSANMTNSRNRLSCNEQFSCSCQHYTTYSLPGYCVGSWRDDVCNMAKLIDDKIQSLKRALNYETSTHTGEDSGHTYTDSQVSNFTECSSPPPMQGGLHRSTAHEDLSPGDINPGEFRSSSRASSSTSSFSYHLSQQGSADNSNRHLHEWSSSYRFPHHLSYTAFDRNTPTIDAGHTLSGSFTDVASDGEVSDSGLRVNAPNVFVPTMRKIFSPVSDSEAVGVIIAEEDEASDPDGDELENPEDEKTEEFGEFGEDANSERPSENEHQETQTQSIENVIDFMDSSSQTDETTIEQNVPTLLVPNIKLRAKSSSPATERRATKFSSVHFFFPTSHNGVVNVDGSPPKVEELRLGEELTSSLKLRSLKLKKAREEFLMGNSGLNGSMSVIVNDDVLNQSPNGLMVKSASEEVVAVRVPNPNESKDQVPKIGGVFSLPRMRRRWSKEKPPTGAAALTRNSVSLSSADDSNSQSCPNTPTAEKKAESGAASWIKNPAKKLFRPKGKYTINN